MPEFVMAQDVPAPPSMASTGDWEVPVVLMTLPKLVMVRGLSVGRRDSGPIGVLIVGLTDRLLLHAFPGFGRQAGHLKRRPARSLAHSASILATGSRVRRPLL